MLDRMLDNKTKLSVVTDQILDYLAENPDAQDTFEGIVQWWLLEKKLRQEWFLVRNALAGLVSENWLLQKRGADSRIRYRLNPDKYDQLRVLATSSEFRPANCR